MRTLILSCNTGGGHNSCAKAISEYFDLKGEECVIEDAIAFISPQISKITSRGFDRMYRSFPSVFTFCYGYAERHAGMFYEKSPIYKLLTLGTDDIYNYIADGNFDAVICTHVFSALMLTAVLEKYPLNISTCFVSTDYTCSPSNKESSLDRYFIPDMSIADEYECPNIPMSKMSASGVPVRQMFYHKKEKNEAKRELGIPETHNHLVMMCGSMGCGPIEKMAECLAESMKEDCDLTIVCGTNENLYKKINDKYGNSKNIHPKGFVTDISTLMDSADLYLTKPGGISVTEAAVKKLPMVFINAVSGCEEYNMNFYLQRGCAKTRETVPEITELCISLLSDNESLNEMRESLNNLKQNNAAEVIYTYIKEQTETKSYESSNTCC